MTLTTRAAKGSALSHAELDANWAHVLDGSNTTYIPPGSGAVSRNVQPRLRDAISAFDFMTPTQIAEVQAGTALLDCAAVLQAAIDAHGAIYVPYGIYRLSTGVQLKGNYSAILGDQKMPIFVIDSANGPAVKVLTNGGANLNEFSRIENLILKCDGAVPSFSATPASSNSGLSIDGSAGSIANPVQRFSAVNVRLLGFGCHVFLREHTNTHLERLIMEQHTDWSATGGYTSANKYVGIYFDGTPETVGGISPNASCEIVECKVNLSGAPANTTRSGFRMDGQDIRDAFFDRCETANGDYGWYIVPTDSRFNFDIHIRRPIIDAVGTVGIYVNSYTNGALNVEGGYISKSGDVTGAGIWIESSNGVTIHGPQLVGFGLNSANDEGIRIKGSNSCAVVGATFSNVGFPISLDASTYCSLTGNVIHAAVNSVFEATPTLSDAIRLFNTATNNTITGNVIRGADATYKYSNGIVIESGSANNHLVGNQIDPTTVTAQYSIGDTSTLIVGGIAPHAAVLPGSVGMRAIATALSASDVDIALGTALFLYIRDTTNGGAAFVIYENAATPVIVSSVAGATTFVTGAPAAGQIQIKNRTGNLGVSVLANANRNNAGLSVSAVVAQL